ncbi:preprotein translocase subunit SecE [Naumannella halotolerans]|uniref:Protein translocase subunit SecE n=1 Tax=Naumannella halotolerans TaxID=993414 RepID=A0A4V6Q2E7_9ACTN|nr:preprotein translocase subunit SecE [Naumannella halotolerans]TDT34398.1 preprotein translocase subunit SecE [Naumannella halotolerans]
MADDKRKDPDEPDTDAVAADDSVTDADATSDPATEPEASEESASEEAVPATRTRATMPKRKADLVEEEDEPARGVLTKKRDRKPKVDRESERTGPLTFVKQCIDELRKVVWPTGDQWRQYFVVVLVFVVVMIAFASLLDLGFGALMLRLFG